MCIHVNSLGDQCLMKSKKVNERVVWFVELSMMETTRTHAISWSSTSLYYSPKCKYSSTCNNKIDNYDSRNPSTAYMYSVITSHSVFIATFDNEQQYTQWYQLCVKTWFLMHVYGLIHISVMILVKHSFWIRKNHEHSIKSTQPYCVSDCLQTMCI